VRLSSKVGGRVERVTVREGEVVEAGQPLVHFDLPELRAQRDQTVAKLKAAQADLLRARNGARAEEKAAAKAAGGPAAARHQRLVAGTRQEEKDQARADLESLQAELKRAELELQRTGQLLRGRAEALAAHDAAVAARGKLQGQADAARAKLEMLEA